jgi:serine/threonine-protein kinase
MTASRPGDLFQPGDLVNNTYRVEAVLGRGGTSDVYRARSEITGRLVALKVLKSEFSTNEDYLLLLTREEAMREIRHDAIVRYSENHRTADGHVYLLIDYIDGPGMDKKLKQGPMSADDLLVICKRVCEGLQAAHDRNIFHRDLSPDNILLRNDDPAQAVIIDFGIAKDTNPGAETIVGNEFAGKYAYAAPEQLAGKTDARTDIYSLGASLLANFRGKSPDIGRNPMEVVQKKSEPLDTTGVPEPLKSILDKMTQPNPDDRFPSAAAVLDALAGQPFDAPENEPLSDATVIVPMTAAAKAAEPSKPVTAPPPPQAAAPKTQKKSAQKDGKKGGMLVPIALGGVVVAGLAGAFAMGFFSSGPSLPVADPYRLSIAKAKDAPPRAVGFVPADEVATALREQMQAQGGSFDLTLATGTIAESWGQDVLTIVDAIDEMDAWRVSLSGNTAEIEGTTTSRPIFDAAMAAFDAGAMGALSGEPDLTLEAIILAPEKLDPILNTFADCGPLTLVDRPIAGYGPESPIIVGGVMSSDESRAALANALSPAVGSRPLDIDVDILNTTLCLIESVLPKAPSSLNDVAFYQGDQDNNPNPTGEFLVGENPVIDVEIPAEVTDGFLTVSVLDVSGNVFHLLPNLNRQDNSVEALRNGESGPVSIRVAYSIQESQQNGGLAFRVDDSTLGKSKVLVIHSSAPLFTEMRPTSESATSYSEALLGNDRNMAAEIFSLDSRILETLAR